MFLRAHPRVVARTSVAASLLLGSALSSAVGPTEGWRHDALGIIVLNDNGAWSWFEDERAVVDPVTGVLVVSSVADASGTGGATRDGNVEVAAHDVETGITRRAVLHPHLEDDDHNSAALYVRRDGRYVAMYSTHAGDTVSRWRVSAEPGVAAAWGAERTLDHGAVATYSNIYPAGTAGRLNAFVRSAGNDPHVLASDDDGTSWRLGGRLLDGPGRSYVRYTADHLGRVHVLTTEQHPRDMNTSIYHGLITDGRLLRSEGRVVDADLSDDTAVRPERLTKVFGAGTGVQAWTVDLHVDAQAQPYAAFSVHTETNEYWYARFDGAGWHASFLAYAGSALYDDEAHYTGLVALDPSDPGRVVVSTDVHPATGEPLVRVADRRQHHELFEGTTMDGGATWEWTAITKNSTADNIRPIIPIWHSEQRALLWLRGDYSAYDDYDLDVVGMITRRAAITPEPAAAATSASDAPWGPPTGPRSGAPRPWCRHRSRARRQRS